VVVVASWKVLLPLLALFASACASPPASSSTPTTADTGQPTATRVPLTPTFAPTETPVPEPVKLQGRGQTATEAVRLPAAVSVASFTHTGSRNFIVKTFSGNNEDLLVNVIGSYEGQRPITSTAPVIFDINADGAWTIHIDAIPSGAQPAFQGRGDAVSGLFMPPAAGAWEIRHDGRRNFIAIAHCRGDRNLVQNEIGQVSGSRVVRFGSGPCYWEVQADGSWSLVPR
jgi:hypothetical protein